ncbi:MAG: zinc ribbon domain-containing protein, partial [Promethearchaeota archaeon]
MSQGFRLTKKVKKKGQEVQMIACLRCGNWSEYGVLMCPNCSSQFLYDGVASTTHVKSSTPFSGKSPTLSHSPSSVSNSICPKCKSPVQSDSKFCSNCGSKIGISSTIKMCPNCGVSLKPGVNFCGVCGKSLKNEELRCPHCRNALRLATQKFCSRCGKSVVKDSIPIRPKEPIPPVEPDKK